MSVIQFPKPEDTCLSDLLAHAGEKLNQEAPPEWVKLQLRAHVARQATAPRQLQAPVRLGALQSNAAGGGGGEFNANSPIDVKAWGVALAVLIALVALMIGSGSTRLGGASDPSAAAQLTRELNSADDEFVPVATPQRWRQLVPRQSDTTTDSRSAAGTSARAWVVAAEVPADQLARFGLPFDPSRAGEPVRAELLLHSSGEILAVRLER